MAAETQVRVNAETEQKPIYFDSENLPWEIITDEHLGKQFKDMKMIFHEDTSMVEYLT